MWISILTILILFVQVAYWLLLWYGISYRKLNLVDNIGSLNPGTTTVSIIICAYNEADNLRMYLPEILHQQPFPHEVIIMDDHSTDDTAQLIRGLQINFPYLRIIHSTTAPHQGKKALIEQGIKAATGTVILLTDADCRPASTRWAELICATLNERLQIVGGLSPFVQEKGWVNLLARFENLVTAMQYLGFATMGLPYMAVGRNMAYTKKMIQDLDFFSGHTHFRAGDDDLTTQKALRFTQIAYCIHPDSFVYARAPASFGAYIRQKIRHLSVGIAYPIPILILLGLFIFSWLLFYPAIVLLFFKRYIFLAMSLLLCRWLFATLTYRIFQKILKQQFSILQIILLDFVFPLLIVLLSLFSLSRRNPKWK